MATEGSDFELQMSIANQLACRLPNKKERVKAFKWIRKLKETTQEALKRNRKHALNLLLSCLQRKRFVGPFEKNPESNKQLTDYKWNYQPADIGELILQQEHQDINRPTVEFHVSGDKSEYLAYQKIPEFGAHFYYAFSPEPLAKWKNINPRIISVSHLNITIASMPNVSSLEEFIKEQSKLEIIPRKENLERSREDIIPAIDREILPKNLHDVSSITIIEREEIQLEGLLKTGDRKISQLHSKTIEKKSSNQIDKSKRAILEESEPHQETHFDSNYETKLEKSELLARLPPRLQKRLSTKYIRKDLRQYPGRDPKLARTPEIFRAGARRPFRKYKLEEFLLPKDEPFRPPLEVFQDLEYQAPEFLRITPRGLRRYQYIESRPRKSQYIEDAQPRESEDIEKSWDRSFQKMQSKRKKRIQQLQIENSIKRTNLQKRIERFKNLQPKQLIFDDREIEVEPEEIPFEKFVYREFPEDEDTERDVTILSEGEMMTDDIFGDDQIANAKALSELASIKELENAEILLESDMETSDLFAENQIADPNVIFKKVVVEEKYSDRSLLKIGQRTLSIPGKGPVTQTFIEEDGNVFYDDTLLRRSGNHTPVITDSVLNAYLDKQLRKYRKDKATSKTYGPWAEQFRSDVERIERGESPVSSFSEGEVLKIPYDHSFLSESEMQTDDMFGKERVAEPSPLVGTSIPQANKKFERLKKEFERIAAERKSRPTLEYPEQDFLEPYVYESFPDRYDRGPLDISFDQSNLPKPLLQNVRISDRQNPLESFERRMDESLQYFQGDDKPSYTTTGRRLVYDPEFLNRRITEVPADDSFLLDDEMFVEDIFGEDFIAEPVPLEKKIPTFRTTPKPLKYSHLYHTEKPYRSRLDDLLPVQRIDEESFPDYYFLNSDCVLSGTEDFVDKIEPPELASGAEPAVLNASEKSGFPRSFLHPSDMGTEDMFGEDQILSPRRLKRVSPGKLAIARSIQQSMDLAELRKRYRRLLSLPPEEPNLPTAEINRLIDEEANLLDPIAEISILEAIPGLIDEPIIEEDLHPPIIPPPIRPGMFDSFDHGVMDSILADRMKEFDLSHKSRLSADEMEDMFDDEMIAEPINIKDISMPMPAPRVSTPKRAPFSHFKDDGREFGRRLVKFSLSKEQLEDISTPEFLSSTISDDIKSLTKSYAPQDSKDSTLLPKESPAEQQESRTPQDSFLRPEEMPLDDMFHPDNILSPRQLRDTSDLEKLKSIFRRLRGRSEIEYADHEDVAQTLLEQDENLMDSVNFRFLRGNTPPLIDEPILENKLVTPLKRPRERYDPFESFERKMDESFQRKSMHGDSLLAESEMSDMFDEDMIAEPVPISKIPMPSPISYRSRRKEILPAERLSEISFPEEFDALDYSYIPKDSEEQLEKQSIPKELASGFERISDVHRTGDASHLEMDDMLTDDIVGPVISPERFREFPGKLLYDLDLGAHQTKKFEKLRNRFQAMHNLPPEEKHALGKRVQESLDAEHQHHIPQGFHLSETPMAQRVQRDFESFEKRLDSSLKRPADISKDLTILSQGEMDSDGIFEAAQIAEPIAIRKIPMPATSTPAKSDYLTHAHLFHPTERYRSKLDDILPIQRLDEESFPSGISGSLLDYAPENISELEFISVPQFEEPTHEKTVLRQSPSPLKRSHLYHVTKPYRQNIEDIEDILPVERLDEQPIPNFPDSYTSEEFDLKQKHPPFLVADTRDYSTPPALQIDHTPSRHSERSFLDEELPPSFLDFDSHRSYPFDLLDPIEFRNFSSQRGILDESLPSGASYQTPLIGPSALRDFLQFSDSIGPPPANQSPGIIRLKELAPGYYQPMRSIDKQRFEEHRRRMAAEEFGLDERSFPAENLEEMTPPISLSRSPPMRHTLLRQQLPLPRPLYSSPKTPISYPQRNRISIYMHPRDRINELIAQQPKYEVVTLPRKTGYSPTQFVTRRKASEEPLLDEEGFPEDFPFEDISLGPLSRALYIPTEQDELEMERDRLPLSPINIPTPPSRPPFLADASPIGRTTVSPHEEGFRWLDNFVPFEEQVKDQRLRTARLQKPGRNQIAEKGASVEFERSLPTAPVYNNKGSFKKSTRSKLKTRLGKTPSVAQISQKRQPLPVSSKYQIQKLPSAQQTLTKTITVEKTADQKTIRKKSQLQTKKDPKTNQRSMTQENEFLITDGENTIRKNVKYSKENRIKRK